jgi:RNA polymerase sigma-70 factor, ECF subfamily
MDRGPANGGGSPSAVFQTDPADGGQFICMSRGAGALNVADARPVPDFHILYQEQFRYVFRTLRRLGIGPTEVDDLVQEVFAVVFQRLSDYDTSRAIEPWLFGIAFRVASTYRRRQSRRIAEVALEGKEFMDEDAVDPEADLADRRMREVVLRALDGLDMDQRAVFIMHEIDDQSIPVIAETLTISINTAYSRLRAGRAKFSARVRRLKLTSAGDQL